MNRNPRGQVARIALVIMSFLLFLTVSVFFIYMQTSEWLRNQQRSSMALADRQLTAIFNNVTSATNALSDVIGAPCTPETIQQLRNQLAITPNLGNIELASDGVVYCSSLVGEVHSGQERREDASLYLTSTVKALPGHPFVITHRQQGKFGLYTSTDGYYLKNILESASTLLPVVLVTQSGWMGENGAINLRQYAGPHNLQLNSSRFHYQLWSNIDRQAVLATSIKNNRLLMSLLIVIAAVAAYACYRWSAIRRSPEQQLTSAILQGEIQAWLQPIVRAGDRQVVGCEVLVRWLNKEGIIPPDQFIPLAEQSGLIIPLTKALITQVTEQFLQAFHPATPFYISLNISAQHLQSPNLYADLTPLLTGLNPNIKLALEITEREIVVANQQVNDNIRRLHQEGVLFALDDFGTGYSTLEILHHVNIDLIKIDKLFVSGIGSNPVCQDIIGNILDLAKRIDARVIAEGVETEQQASFLQQQGDLSLQGYLFSKPLPISAFKDYLVANNVWNG